MNLSVYKNFMVELAEKSGDYIRPWFGNKDLKIEGKEDGSPVTIADRGAESLMRELIERRFPEHGIIGEEYGEMVPNAEWVWVLDPIDGTKSFASACPLFGTLIALLHKGKPVLGAINQPIQRQLMIGDGKLTELNGKPVTVRPCSSIEKAVLLTSDPLNPAKYQNGHAFQEVAERALVVRTWGDCYGYLLLASGWADIMCDPIMNPWDIQALIPIIRGAGGIISDWQGKDPVDAKSILAAGPGLHGDLVKLLNP